MIGTDIMSSTSMDISETFRPEDLSKTDFFDFVTAPEISGIGIVGNDHDGQPPGSNNNTNGSSAGEHPLHGYEQFWGSDKDQNRLESTIFEDLDRYCWQQQQQNNTISLNGSSTNPSSASSVISQISSTDATTLIMRDGPQSVNDLNLSNDICSNNNNTNSNNNDNSNTNNNDRSINNNHINNNNNNNSNNISNNSNNTKNNNNNNNISNNNDTDGQIYTLTVLNGNESWLKRDGSSITDSQLTSQLDLESLLGTFPGYVKSEFVYEDSGFDADSNAKDGISHGQQHLRVTNLNNSIVPSITGSVISPNNNNINDTSTQFQNNNNDWHMVNNNSQVEQNSAESLLRSALQGKGYSKGLHLQNGLTLMQQNSDKDEELRRALFTNDTESLAFADSTLASPMFDDSQTQTVISNSTTPTILTSNRNGNADLINHQNHNATGIIVDDMFLSLESAFTDDFEKIKRIANEVQQFCSTNDYPEVIMEVAAAAHLQRDANGDSINSLTNVCHQNMQMVQQQPSLTVPVTVQQRQKQSITTTQSEITSMKSSNNNINNNSNNSPTSISVISTKTNTKKYKRSAQNSSANNNNNNNKNMNNNNNNLSTNNNNNVNISNVNKTNSMNSLTKSNSNTSLTNNNTSPTHCNGQRKERSLHYCSICSKGFKDKYSVNVHIRTHTGEKPFSCSLCGKSFRQKAHLAKHYQTHLAQKSNGNVIKNGKHNVLNRNNNLSSSSSSSASSANNNSITNKSILSINSSSNCNEKNLKNNTNNDDILTIPTRQLSPPIMLGGGVTPSMTPTLLSSVTTTSLPNNTNTSNTSTLQINSLPPVSGILTNR